MTDTKVGYEIRHLVLDGAQITEALYVHEGRRMCLRFAGHLHFSSVDQVLKSNRKRAAGIDYVGSGFNS